MTNFSTYTTTLPAFEVVGFTKIVTSGGEQYDAVRRDGRWELLRQLAGENKTLYGVASVDAACPKGTYRYTLGVRGPLVVSEPLPPGEELFTISIPATAWLIFRLDDFAAQYGDFWARDPYRMVQAQGYAFDSRVGLHIDAYDEGYVTEHDAMAFMMPVKV